MLDKYSYLTALEQEIERKKKQLVDEERILHEKEQEIQNRKHPPGRWRISLGCHLLLVRGSAPSGPQSTGDSSMTQASDSCCVQEMGGRR